MLLKLPPRLCLENLLLKAVIKPETRNLVFCTLCGQPTKKEIPPLDDHERDVCTSCGHIQYVNPKIVVGSVVFFQRRLLLCKRAIEPRTGFWTMPAGFMEMEESLEEGAKREAWEEARADILIGQTLAIYSIPRLSQVQIFFMAELLSEQFQPGPESTDVVLVEPENIPWSDLAFKTVHLALHHALKVRDKGGSIVPECRTIA